MGLLRRIQQRFSDKELGVQGAEIERLNEDLVQLQIKADSLSERHERLRARYGMREVRAAVRGGDGGRPVERERLSDEEILGEIEALDRQARARGLN